MIQAILLRKQSTEHYRFRHRCWFPSMAWADQFAQVVSPWLDKEMWETGSSLPRLLLFVSVRDPGLGNKVPSD